MVPGDGMPPIEDWIQTFESMLFQGIDLSREPLDGSLNTENRAGLKKHVIRISLHHLILYLVVYVIYVNSSDDQKSNVSHT